MKILAPLLLLAFSSAAMAEVPILKMAMIDDFEYSGDGCPQGSVSHEGSLLDALYTEWGVYDGVSGFLEISYSKLGVFPRMFGGDGQRESHCTVTFTVLYEPGYRFTLHKTYRDDVLDFRMPNDAVMNTSYFFAKADEITTSAEYSWPKKDTGVAIGTPVSVVPASTDCSGRTEMTIKTDVKMLPKAKTKGKSKRDDDEIDDISMAFVGNEAMEIIFRKCD